MKGKLKNFTKEIAIKLYINQKLSSSDISKKYNCSNVAVLKKLRKCDVTIRSNSEAHVGLGIGIKNSNYKHGRYKKIKKHSKPRLNRPEKILKKLLGKDYKFVGNKKFWIENFNPDFINVNGEKKIVEMFGNYWHNLPNYKIRDKKRIKTYKKYGYKVLVVWEKELKNLKNVKRKIKNFCL